MIRITGGVCAAKGFQASGIYCGIRKNKTKKDLALIVSDTECSAACVYTQNLVKGAPLLVTRQNLQNGRARAVLCNSGNANTCNANGIEIAESMCKLLEQAANIPATDVIVASTGVIGASLNLEPIAAGMPQLVQGLAYHNSTAAEQAILTTDTVEKNCAVRFTLDGKECTMGGIAKGSGMIHPDMATLLCFVTTDAAISPVMLQKALKNSTDVSFNCISVDGDTSTNDMFAVLANGLAGNKLIDQEGKDFAVFCEALTLIATDLCKKIAADGEGATKLIECVVSNAKDAANARLAAKSVISSSLFKAAMFGADANWGRVLCALGYSKADLNIDAVDVTFRSAGGNLPVCKKGKGIPFSEADAKKVLLEKEVQVLIDLNDGKSSAVAWGCDLTYDYVKINGDYRT